MKHLLLCLLLLFLFSCTQQYVDPEGSTVSVCNVKNPVKDLPWLKKMIDGNAAAEKSGHCVVYEVLQGYYEGQEVLIPLISGPLCCPFGYAAYNCGANWCLSFHTVTMIS
jgi:hypothetical protein